MNPSPRLRYRGFDGDPRDPGCGRVAMESRARAFWQSRSVLRDPPELTDIPELARKIRAAFTPGETQ